MPDSATVREDLGIYQEMSALAAALGAVNLSQGVPEALNDALLDEAVSASLGAGWQYSPTRGAEDLRRAISADYDGSHGADGVLVTSGCTESLFVALAAAREHFGDAVVYAEPYYSYYPGLARLAGLTPRPVPLRMGGGKVSLDLDAVTREFRAGARILLLNTPHNPTGWVLDRPTAAALAELLEERDGMIVLDEVYRDFVYSDRDAVDVWRLDGLAGRCLVANSVSKSFAATGMRIGWLAGPPGLLAAAHLSHMHLSNCQPAPLQRAAARLFLVVDRTRRGQVRDRYRRKRDLLLQALAARGFDCVVPDGGHFILADYGRLDADSVPKAFAEAFARSDGVVPLPVDGFFSRPAPRMVRFSFAASLDAVEEACARLHRKAVQ